MDARIFKSGVLILTGMVVFLWGCDRDGVENPVSSQVLLLEGLKVGRV